MDVLDTHDHQLGMTSLNLEVPCVFKVVSWRLLVEDGYGLSIGSKLNGDVFEGVGDVTFHQHAAASGSRHFLWFGTYGVVPLCGESTVFTLCLGMVFDTPTNAPAVIPGLLVLQDQLFSGIRGSPFCSSPAPTILGLQSQGHYLVLTLV